MTDLTSPQMINFATFLGLGFLGILAAFGQWLGKRKENAPPASKDVVIDHAVLADRVAMERMTDTLRQSNEIARNHREHDTAMLYELRDLNRSLARVESLLGKFYDRGR